MFNYDSWNVYVKWVKDMIDMQEVNGNVVGIVLIFWRWDFNWVGLFWDVVIFIVFFYFYCYIGDIEIMCQVYLVVECYLKYIEMMEDEWGLINYGLGDWLFYKVEILVDFMVIGFVYWDNLMMVQMVEFIGCVEDR